MLSSQPDPLQTPPEYGIQQNPTQCIRIYSTVYNTYSRREGRGGGLILVNVAFITLLERKILGYSQLRNKAELWGFYSRGNNSQLKVLTDRSK
jgi:hypothetical protein